MRIITITMFSAILALSVGCGGGGGGAGPAFAGFQFDPTDFVGVPIDNPRFPLTPGKRYVFQGMTASGLERSVFEVTRNTKTLLGIVCVEVHDQGFLDGALVEDTLDWFAQDDEGNVLYFGEDTKQISGGVVTGTTGSWQYGLNGATPGVVMPAVPFLGQTYSEEDAPGVAEDMAQVVGLGEGVTTPLATYAGCLHTENFTPLEPGVIEDKFYASGVGAVLELTEDGERIELIAIESF